MPRKESRKSIPKVAIGLIIHFKKNIWEPTMWQAMIWTYVAVNKGDKSPQLSKLYITAYRVITA